MQAATEAYLRDLLFALTQLAKAATKAVESRSIL